MPNLMTRLAASARKRSHYNRTVAALRAMPEPVARDLGLDPANAEAVAARAVYGA